MPLLSHSTLLNNTQAVRDGVPKLVDHGNDVTMAMHSIDGIINRKRVKALLAPNQVKECEAGEGASLP